MRVVVEGKRLVVVEDSIVRGTILSKLVDLFRNAGPREGHVRVSCRRLKRQGVRPTRAREEPGRPAARAGGLVRPGPPAAYLGWSCG